jgi:MerR family transcriptional regulator, light-induced transcriptional regulator
VARYSIKNLEDLSGIKAHTLRAWEKRYGLIKPKRTKTNIRYYDDEDLKYILNVSLLSRHGYKISDIAKMSHEEVNEAIHGFSDDTGGHHNYINMLKIALIDLDEGRFEKVFSSCILQFGLEYTVINILYPFLEKVGLMWQTNCITPCHEHFISGLIRQKIIVAIDGQSHYVAPDAPTYLLFLPENEEHEIGLLMASYVLKSRGNKVIYLGSSAPFEDLKSIYQTAQPDYMFTMAISQPIGTKLHDWVYNLKKNFSDCEILASGTQIIRESEKLNKYSTIVRDIPEFLQRLSIPHRKKANF